MTKILMTSVRDDEQTAINEYAKEHNIEIITTPKLIDDAVELTADVDGLVIQQRSKVPADIYEKLHTNGLKQIATRTAGFDMVDIKKANENDLVVTNVPAYSPRSVAEFALMQIFRLLIGVGRIGGTLAKLLHALGATVLGYDTNPRTDLDRIVQFVSKEELLKQADVVSLHVDLNPASKGLLTANDFAMMKPTAGLVNASRGPVVNTADLVTALKAGEIAAAALDTFAGEETVAAADRREKGLDDQPLVKELHEMDNVILTPHIAFFTNLAVKNMVDISLDDVMTILNGGKSPHEITL